MSTWPNRQAVQQLQKKLAAYIDDLDQTRAVYATSMLRAETGFGWETSRFSGAENPPNLAKRR
jgi:hypothetical protein